MIPHQHFPSSSVQGSPWWPCGFSEVKLLLSAVLPWARVASSLLDIYIVYSFLMGNNCPDDPNKKTSDFCRTQHVEVETMEWPKEEHVLWSSATATLPDFNTISEIAAWLGCTIRQCCECSKVLWVSKEENVIFGLRILSIQTENI